MGTIRKILAEWASLRFREKAAKRLLPLNVIAFVTYRCTNRCATCNIWQRSQVQGEAPGRGELGPQDWERIVEKLSRAKAKSVEVFGGDALLRKDIVLSLIEKCSDLEIETYLPTNCNLLDEPMAASLVSAGLGTVYFSIDGSEDLQNSIRGNPRSYSSAVQAIGYIQEARKRLGKGKPRMGILTTISARNADRVEALFAEFRKYPVDFVNPHSMGEMTQEDVADSIIDGIRATPYFTSTSPTSNLLSEAQARSFRELLRKLHRERRSWPFHLGISSLAASLDNRVYTEGIYPDFRCYVCTTVATLTPLGRVVPCPFFTDYVLGDIHSETALNDIWGNAKHRAFVEKQRNRGFAICRKCSMRHFYPGTYERICQVLYPCIDRLRAR